MSPEALKHAQWAIYILDALCVLVTLDLARQIWRAVRQARTFRKWGTKK